MPADLRGMTVARGGYARTDVHKLIHPYQMARQLQEQGFMDWRANGPVVAVSSAGAIPTASQGQIDGITLPGTTGGLLEYFQTTAQTLIPAWTLASLGVEAALDQVENETVEYVPGGNSSVNPFAYTVNTSPPMIFRVAFSITDVSGMDQFGIGWRKQEAYAVPVSFLTTGDGVYTDFFGVGFAATSADPNTVRRFSDLNNSGSTLVDSVGFTWADGLTHVLEIRLKGRYPTVYINGIRAGQPIAKDGLGGAITSQTTLAQATQYAFDVDDILVPFIFIRQDADLTPVYIKAIQVGLASSFGLDAGNVGSGR